MKRETFTFTIAADVARLVAYHGGAKYALAQHDYFRTQHLGRDLLTHENAKERLDAIRAELVRLAEAKGGKP